MVEIPTPKGRPIDWSRWIGCALLAVVIALIAKPIWTLVEILCIFGAMSNVNG